MQLFDIIGPVMIGPSSSHTAGAARIGRITRMLLGEEVQYADIRFHGSFAKTWEGHGTDRAVIGGLLGLQVDDERLRKSRALAEQAGMRYTISAVQLRDAHPNTVLIDAVGVSGAQISVGERCRRVVMAFQFCLQSFHLCQDFFLGSGVNTLADQFACHGIDANRDPCFPGTVASFSQISFAISTLQRHRFLLSSTSPAETDARSKSSFPL